MKKDVYSVTNGESVGSVQMSDSVFNNEVRDHVIYEAVKAELANKRQGTVSTKERSFVAGTGAKPYRQKGTGRARAGSKKSPIWVGGGTTFGPTPRDFKNKLPKKIRMRAMVSLLSKKNQNDQLKVIDDFEFKSGKTKEIAAILSKVCNQDRVVLIVKDGSGIIKRAVRNIPWVKCYSGSRMVYKDVFYSKELLILKSALEGIEAHYGSVKKGN